MQSSPLTSPVLFHLGPVPMAESVVTTWAIMLVLSLLSRYLTRRLQPTPGKAQMLLEILVSSMQQQIEQVIGAHARRYLPLLGTLFIFLVFCNLCELLPGVQAPTGKPETPAALALVVFFAVQYYGVRTRGIRGYLGSFAEPKVIMLPLNILSQITRTFSLMVRLFGNVMSGGFVIALLIALVGLFVPIPLMALEMLIGLVQAYIFAVLATVFIGAAVGGADMG